MLARLKLLYFHSDEDYFHLSHPQAKELETFILQTESDLKNKQMDDTQADILAQQLRNIRKAYNQPSSIRP